MNILLILYGGTTANSLNHITAFAKELIRRGHFCALIMRLRPGENTAGLPLPAWAQTDAKITADMFPDRRPADIIHAWTARHPCLEALLSYVRNTRFSGRVIVHLEDNERLLLERTAGVALEAGLNWSERRLRPFLRKGLSHPMRHGLLLAAADAISVITPRLGELIPCDIPVETLLPGLDLKTFHPTPGAAELRIQLGLRDGERIVVYPGGANLINADELRTLYAAVVLLNRGGFPVKLVRTGPPTPWFIQSLSPEERAVSLELGFVERGQIPRLLSLADVLVQPGRAGPFNDYRLPSKIPEFLASGRPVILPATNIARLMREGHEALFLHEGSPREIADCCERLFRDPELATTLGTAGRRFAEAHFDIVANTSRLETLYRQTLDRPASADWSRVRTRFHDEADLFPLASGRSIPHSLACFAEQRRKQWLRRIASLFYRRKPEAGT